MRDVDVRSVRPSTFTSQSSPNPATWASGKHAPKCLSIKHNLRCGSVFLDIDQAHSQP